MCVCIGNFFLYVCKYHKYKIIMMVTGALYGFFCEDVVCVGAVCVHFGVFPGDSGQFEVIRDNSG